MYRHIRALPAGHAACRWIAGVLRAPSRYHSIAAVYCEAEGARDTRCSSAEQRRAVMRAALLDSVRHHLVADVPVGAFLSAGIDSGALVGLMRDAGQSEIETVTLVVRGVRGQRQRRGAARCGGGAQRTARAIRRGSSRRPSSRPTCRASWLPWTSRRSMASTRGSYPRPRTSCGLKVAVSGLGGDELLRRLSLIPRHPEVGRLG